ncbi:hypothetical protein [Saccharibacillus alkalitolerans]|uniref:Uncharacterized protein n=1 Tax=Saccharibacillus alkalitolerans TaxID=2705290 RepID=A0ABX0F5I6_9BACL|nr:hypothetical protein [Saccharibacillus alkalitolerans]NGZ75244.1 hypothetical protein [Saccharibacillus alkalitolerans]
MQKNVTNKNDLPPLLPFRIAAAALKTLYVLPHAAVILFGYGLAFVLAAMSGYAFNAAAANTGGGPGAMLLSFGAGAVLLAAALPVGLKTTNFARRFLRGKEAGIRNPSRRPAGIRTLEEAYRSGKSLFGSLALTMFGTGLFSLGLGMALDGLNMLMLPGVALSFHS